MEDICSGRFKVGKRWGERLAEIVRKREKDVEMGRGKARERERLGEIVHERVTEIGRE